MALQFSHPRIASHESTIVANAKGTMLLKEGEEERFKEIGARVGTTLAAKGRTAPS